MNKKDLRYDVKYLINVYRRSGSTTALIQAAINIENLTLLCPNCHSLTETFAGKNIGKNK